MADRHQLDECHWTGAALAAVLDHELYQDGQAPYRQVISTIPVLKAYQKFLKVEHVKELAQVMDEHRKTMQANWKAAADQPAAGKAPREWTPENYLAWQKTMVAVAPKAALLKNIEGLDETDEQYLIDEFLTLMNQEAHQWPDGWTFEALQQVLGMTMPLDPRIKPYQIIKIVALFDAFFDYLHQQGDLNDDQYAIAKRTLLHMQPAQEALASLDRKDRLTQLVLSLAQAEGVDINDRETAQKWMATHRTLLGRSCIHGVTMMLVNKTTRWLSALLKKERLPKRQRLKLLRAKSTRQLAFHFGIVGRKVVANTRNRGDFYEYSNSRKYGRSCNEDRTVSSSWPAFGNG